MSVWKKIEGYDDYMISNFGEVKSLKYGKEHIKIPQKDRKGKYLLVMLSKKGHIKNMLVHRLVANAFVEKIEGKNEVNHINCNTQDNRAENLEWVTKKENQKHAYANHRLKIPTYKGNFGKHHNKSIGYVLLCPDGIKRTFYSGLDFNRKTGLDQSSLSYAAIKKGYPYTFKRGKIKGYSLLETFKSYVGKL